MPFRPRLLLLAIALLAPVGLSAQTSANANTTVSTSIYVPIAITKTSDLSFGDVFPGGGSGTVVVDPGGAAPVATDGVSLGVHAAVPAVYSLTGKKNASFTLTLPNDGSVSLTAEGTGTGTAMPVTKFTAAVGSGATTAGPSVTGTLGSGTNGAQSLKVGATMTVGTAQAEGEYRGTFTVTVAYN